MSKYAVQYYSASRKEYVTLEEMHSGHIANAYRKRLGTIAPFAANDELLRCMKEELESRGAAVSGKEITWPTEAA